MDRTHDDDPVTDAHAATDGSGAAAPGDAGANATPAPPAPPAAPPASVLPPPVPPMTPSDAVPSFTPAPPAPRSGRTVGLVVGIVAAIVLVLGGLGVAIFFLVQNAVSAFEQGGLPSILPVEEEPVADYPDKQPLIPGEPGSPVAADPTLCPDQCFTVDDFALTAATDADYVALGLPDVPPGVTYPDSTAQKEFLYTASAWESNEGSPEECFPVTIYSPVAATFAGRPESGDDPVGFTGYHMSEDEYSTLSESPRLFESSASAEKHMADMLELVAGCQNYDLGTGATFWTADVTPMPALDGLPPTVAAVGWVEDSPFGRFYGADLQRGNLVLRASLYTDGAVSEEAWRSFLLTSATILASLDT